MVCVTIKNEGVAQGRAETTVDLIVRAMKKQNLSFDGVCDFLDIPEEQRGGYHTKVMAKLKEPV